MGSAYKRYSLCAALHPNQSGFQYVWSCSGHRSAIDKPVGIVPRFQSEAFWAENSFRLQRLPTDRRLQSFNKKINRDRFSRLPRLAYNRHQRG